MENEKKISANVFKNILLAVIVMLYFILINFLYYRINENVMIIVLKSLSGIILMLGIIIMEIAYKKDSGIIGINSIELLVLSGFTLSIEHVVEAKKLDFPNYILVSSYIFSIYYILKAIVIYTKEKKEKLKSLSDIKEIVDIKPTKKEAEKKQK